MEQAGVLRLEDIADELTSYLKTRNYSPIDAISPEVVRYERRGSAIGFQVGMEINNGNLEHRNPPEDSICLHMEYTITPGLFKNDDEEFSFAENNLPNRRLLSRLYASFGMGDKIPGVLLGMDDKNPIQNGRVSALCIFYFQRGAIAPQEIVHFIGELVTYTSDTIHTNMEMLGKVASHDRTA